MRSSPQALPTFVALFGAEPSTFATAPGRVNLLGEHTDYNLGWVLPTAIPQHTRVELRPHNQSNSRGRPTARVVSSAVAPSSLHTYTLGHESPRHDWLDYVQGVTQALASLGHTLPSFDLRITSDIPLGSGLSSSAALLIALLRGFRQTLSLSFSDIDLARLAQQVENDFVGAPVGILDPMACGLCQPGTALFLDTRDLQYQPLPLPTACELVVIHSGIVHAHGQPPASSQSDATLAVADYRVRRRECEQAAQALGLHSLRELQDDPAAAQRISGLPATLMQRVRHVLSENQRVLAAAALLQKSTHSEDDLQQLGALFSASHRSQRDDYQVSLPAIDTLVEIAQSDPAIVPGGARLTGGGFGGSIVAVARWGQAAAAAARIALTYQQQTGHCPTVLVPEPSAATEKAA